MSKKQQKTTSHDYWTYPDMTKTLEIALYYGFTPTDPVAVEKSDRDCAKQFSSTGPVFIRPEEKASLLRTWFGEGQGQSPVTIATMHDEHRKNKTFEYSLDVIGTNRSIADATLIKTTFEIVRSQGYEEISLELNSIGDRESFARYTRELGNYFRKHMNELCDDCRQAVKKDIYKGLSCIIETCKSIADRVPHPMNYLSEPSRRYFMELLERLERTESPYNINTGLIANNDCAMHAVFQIYGNDGKE
ncbi:MAG: histidyl-tRNA synthetase, histidyl-tRNA synthetase, partial [Candidatus Paceibacter sp.]|nr:histidyl-tRNA synthetase, histidyl-tRNA synthetase [Candidatus Paceibacter sp.]